MQTAAPILLVPLGFVLLGGAFVAFGVRAIRRRTAFRRRAIRCPGVVTEMRAIHHDGGPNSTGNTLYHPVLAFTTADGRDVQTVSPYGTSPPSARAGQRLDVLYDPADPSRAQQADQALGSVMNVLFIAFGAVFALIGLLVGAGIVAFMASFGDPG